MLARTLKHFCHEHKTRCKGDDIELFLKSSPVYPSLLSVIHTLRYAGIKAIAGKCDFAYLSKLQMPFLLHFKAQNEERLMMARWNTFTGMLSIYSPKDNNWQTKDKFSISKSGMA